MKTLIVYVLKHVTHWTESCDTAGELVSEAQFSHTLGLQCQLVLTAVAQRRCRFHYCLFVSICVCLLVNMLGLTPEPLDVSSRNFQASFQDMKQS